LVAHGGKGFPLLVGAEQQYFATRIIEYVGDVIAAVLGIERHDDQAQSHRRLIEDHPFGRIAQHHRHAVAGLKAVALECRLPARDLAVDLRPSVVAPVGVLLVIVAIRDSLGRAFHALAKQAVERHRFR